MEILTDHHQHRQNGLLFKNWKINTDDFSDKCSLNMFTDSVLFQILQIITFELNY